MSALVIIPARMGATRFPGKPLAQLSGKPVIQHVYENSIGAPGVDGALVATDSEDIYKAVQAFGGRAVMTSASHVSGTDRVAEAAAGLGYDIIVNVQGDEPMMRPGMIEQVVGLLEDPGASMGTLARRIDEQADAKDPNVVKVVFNGDGFALYFSRAAIPYIRDGAAGGGGALYQHIGIYAYRAGALQELAGAERTALERAEGLEQLRALERGMGIKVGITSVRTIGVDTPEDLERVQKWLR